MPFLNASDFPYGSGMILLGRDPLTFQDVGITLETHALTVAGAGTGKGSCQIIPNLLRWPHSALVVDPSGEAVERTAAFRANDLGQAVAVLDPFGYASGVDAFRASVDPMAYVAGVDDLRMLADGLVLRSGREAQPHWNDSAASVIAGLLAFIRADPDLRDDERNLASLRPLLSLLQDVEARRDLLPRILATDTLGDLGRETAARLSSETSETANILSTVDTQTAWLSSPEIGALLKPSSLDLRSLKRGRMTVYLVLPPDRMELHSRFLRLFVRLAMSLMWEKVNGSLKATPCLFLLDEFPALGRINEIRNVALPQGRKYGLHVWPFVQDWGQLVDLYGQAGAQSFEANTDAVSYYGLSDLVSLRHVSERLGTVTPDDVAKDVERTVGLLPQRPTETAMIERSLAMAKIGKPRFPPEAVAAELHKPQGAKVARRIWVKLPSGWLSLLPAPYFEAAPSSGVAKAAGLWASARRRAARFRFKALGVGFLAALVMAALLVPDLIQPRPYESALPAPPRHDPFVIVPPEPRR
jgi:type IV secretion system protein VirD4